MPSPITILWFTSSILACWGFSLCVRLLSEAIARKRKQLVQERTSKEILLAMLMILFALAGSVGAAVAAVFEQYSRGRYYPDGYSSMGAIGGSVGLFAVCLIIWAAVGDRSRGRIRCPKCWYDMSQSKGLQCPECGKKAQNDRQYLKSRRPRWAFAVGAVLIVFGGSSLVLDEKVQDDGVLALMPNWMMLIAWDSLPDNWVYNTGLNNRESTLVDRILYSEISSKRIYELGEQLFDRMIADINERWDSKNHAVLYAVYRSSQQTQYNDQNEIITPWIPPEDRLQRLFIECARDVLDALAAADPNALQLEILALDPRRYFSGVDVYALCRDWIVELEHQHIPFNSYKRIFVHKRSDSLQTIQLTLENLEKESEFVDVTDIFLSDDPLKKARAHFMSVDIGLPDEHLQQSFDTWNSVDEYTKNFMLLGHAVAIKTADEARAIAELTKLDGYLSGSDSQQRAYALSLMVPLSKIRSSGNQRIRQAEQSLIETTYSLINERSVEENFVDLAIKAVIEYDDSGKYSFRVISNLMKQTGAPSDWVDSYMIFDFEYSDERVHNWIEYFEPLSMMPNIAVQTWIAKNCPERTGTPSDERINDMLSRLEQVDDVDLSYSAFTKQDRRRTYQDRMGN